MRHCHRLPCRTRIRPAGRRAHVASLDHLSSMLRFCSRSAAGASETPSRVSSIISTAASSSRDCGSSPWVCSSFGHPFQASMRIHLTTDPDGSSLYEYADCAGSFFRGLLKGRERSSSHEPRPRPSSKVTLHSRQSARLRAKHFLEKVRLFSHP